MASYKYKQKFKRAYESFNKRMSKIGEREGTALSKKGYKYQDYISNVSANLSKMTNTQVASAIRSLNSKVRSSLTEMFVSYDVEKDVVTKGIMKAGNVIHGRVPSVDTLRSEIKTIKDRNYSGGYRLNDKKYSKDFIQWFENNVTTANQKLEPLIEGEKFNERYDLPEGTVIGSERFRNIDIQYVVEADGLHIMEINSDGVIISDSLARTDKDYMMLEDDLKAEYLLSEVEKENARRKVEEQNKQQVMTDLNSLYLQEMVAYLAKNVEAGGIVEDILNKIDDSWDTYGSGFFGKAVDKYIADGNHVPEIPDSGGTYDEDLVPMLEFFDDIYSFIDETPPEEIEAYEGAESWAEIK